ncbi:DNA binding domain-containing protein, excisionase family [Saccharopolyspora shandongensis]|uniref:DNA binding domain-containing protein, excisionase family n=1 Tax=Saccharopolyspora shandongensis TaxID=418495 RepID=A0A1H2T8N1_9PSEU|nr:DNA binding domain-containing protein, excisionase family [Saccharopolyspora shandongensis]
MPLQTPKRKPPVQPRTDAPHDGATPASRSTFLYRPAEAAKHLAVKESWLRRKASLRAIPCTFLGKHLRFSDDDVRVRFSFHRAWIWPCRISGMAVSTLS